MRDRVGLPLELASVERADSDSKPPIAAGREGLFGKLFVGLFVLAAVGEHTNIINVFMLHESVFSFTFLLRYAHGVNERVDLLQSFLVEVARSDRLLLREATRVVPRVVLVDVRAANNMTSCRYNNADFQRAPGEAVQRFHASDRQRRSVRHTISVLRSRIFPELRLVCNRNTRSFLRMMTSV